MTDERAAPAARRAPTPPPFGGADLNSTTGAILLAGFLLVLIGGVLGLVEGIRRVDDGRVGEPGLEAAIVVISGVASLGAAFLVWQGRTDHGGMLAIVCGVIFLVLGPETAGLLAVLGGILAVVARRSPARTL